VQKPFNPHIGETYEAYWPDESRCYGEYIYHHPSIIATLVEHPEQAFRLFAIYEVNLKAVEFGNALVGEFRGKTTVQLANESEITFTYPHFKITGLLFGKRTMHYIGEMKFEDKKNNITAVLKFPVNAQRKTVTKMPLDFF
jgi:hypothetical protein